MPKIVELGVAVGEIEVFSGPRARAEAPPDLLIEIPHGATTEDHFLEVRRLLSGKLPEDLEAFYFVNTDVGAPECARAVGALLTKEPSSSLCEALKVLVVRSLVPRTFIDCNRVLDEPVGELGESGLTRGLPEYITDGADIESLVGLHRAYQETVDEWYELVCGAGGLALALHTYAPRSVEIERVDDGIVAALRQAYEPEIYATWVERPPVDIISETVDGDRLASAGLVASVIEKYKAEAIEVSENATYRLHPVSTGYSHSVRFPEKVMCIEIRRDLLADSFAPFAAMHISREKATRMASPIAAAFAEHLSDRR